MYVCLCKGITEEQLKQMSSAGMREHDILKSLGVGSDCGICISEALQKIKGDLPHHPKDSQKIAEKPTSR